MSVWFRAVRAITRSGRPRTPRVDALPREGNYVDLAGFLHFASQRGDRCPCRAGGITFAVHIGPEESEDDAAEGHNDSGSRLALRAWPIGLAQTRATATNGTQTSGAISRPPHWPSRRVIRSPELGAAAAAEQQLDGDAPRRRSLSGAEQSGVPAVDESAG